MDRLVLAYSGGAASTLAIPWIKEREGVDVITLTLDLGQGRDLDRLRDRALAAGARRAHVLDVRDELAERFVLPALQAGVFDREDFGGLDLARGLDEAVIARTLLEVAALEQAPRVAHGSTRGRLTASIHAIDPSARVLGPSREWTLDPSAAVEYAKARGVAVSSAAPVGDRSLWGRSLGSRATGQRWDDPPEDLFTLTRTPADAPHDAAVADLSFERGAPVAINGVPMPPAELIANLETIAAVHGVGRVARIVRSDDGRVSREWSEMPALVVLRDAHAALQRAAVPPDLQSILGQLAVTCADLIDRGRWFTPAREAIGALVAHAQTHVTGVVRVTLAKGECRLARVDVGAPMLAKAGA